MYDYKMNVNHDIRPTKNLVIDPNVVEHLI
jgi:hypothetical protein